MATASDDFIEQLDAIGVINSHTKSVLRIEERAGESLLKIYRDLRVELRDRLDLLSIDTFSAQSIRGVIAQVELGIEALKLQLDSELTAFSGEISRGAVADLLSEILRFEAEFRGAVTEIPIDKVLVADSTRGLKLIQYQSSIETYGRFLSDSINRILVQGIITKKPYSQLVREVAGRAGFLDSQAFRAQRLVRTELHSIYDLTRLEALRAAKETTLPDLMKISIDPLDARTALDSIAVMGQIKEIDEPFRFKGKVTDPRTGETTDITVKPFMNHPNRPNDRGVTAPYRKTWENSVG